MNNIPEIKVGIVAVSRDCFPAPLAVNRRKAVVDAYTKKYGAEDIYECPITIVESEIDMVNALEDIKNAGCNALCVYLGNFGPEISETLLAKHFDGPVMFSAAAEESGSTLGVQGRGDAYCGMLNASYNLALRNTKAWIPENPVRDAEGVADNIHDFLPIARVRYGLSNLKIISFGPRPANFFACNAPVKQLFNLGVEIDEESELDLYEAYLKHEGDERIAAIKADMVKEMGYAEDKVPPMLDKLAQYELTLTDLIEEHRGYRKYVALTTKCWPAFQDISRLPCWISTTPYRRICTSRASRANLTMITSSRIRSWASTAAIPAATCSRARIWIIRRSWPTPIRQSGATERSRAISNPARSHSTDCSRPLTTSSVRMQLRARFFRLRPVRSDPSVYSPSRRWDASIAMS